MQNPDSSTGLTLAKEKVLALVSTFFCAPILLVLKRNLQPEIFTGIMKKYPSGIPQQVKNSKGRYQKVQFGGNIYNRY
jgi:hypothetical protein